MKAVYDKLPLVSVLRKALLFHAIADTLCAGSTTTAAPRRW